MRSLLRGSLLIAVFCLLWPQVVGLPFLRQNPVVLQSALAVSRYLSAIEAACVLAALVALLRVPATRGRLVMAATVVLCGGLSQVDIYSLIFHPLERPSFEAASVARLDAREKVLAITVGQTTRAYPIRSLSYHHIVNDVLEGVAVAATY